MKVTRKEAQNIILENVFFKSFEVVTLDQAYERVLYEDIYAKYNIPESDKSAIDGFAFNVDFVKEYPVRLKIVGETKAGDKEVKSVGEKEAVFVMTGGMIPNNANGVVRIEDVEVVESEVIVKKPVKKWDLINLKGSEIKNGDKILSKGEFLEYKKISLLANLGFYQIKVYKKPKIGIIVTGNEVKEVWEDSDKAGVKNVNFYILKGLLSPFADITYYGRVEDEPKEMSRLFLEALNENDILLSSGGASKGKYDFIKDVAKRIELDVKFTTTNIRPGRPLIFGTKNDKLFFGLPGYPSALLVNFYDFLLPAVKKMAGIREYNNKIFKAFAKESFKSKEGRVDFIRVRTEFEGGKVYVKSAGSQQTSNFLSTSFSDALAIVDDTRGNVREGEIIDIMLIDTASKTV